MDKERKILIGVVVVVVLLAVVALFFSNQIAPAGNETAVNNTTGNPVATNITQNNTNSSNSSSLPSGEGWKWSEQEQGYVNEYVDDSGNLHVQTTDGHGSFHEVVYYANGTVYRDGKDITEDYNKDFN